MLRGIVDDIKFSLVLLYSLYEIILSNSLILFSWFWELLEYVYKLVKI